MAENKEGSILVQIGVLIVAFTIINWLSNRPAKLPTSPVDYGFAQQMQMYQAQQIQQLQDTNR